MANIRGSSDDGHISNGSNDSHSEAGSDGGIAATNHAPIATENSKLRKQPLHEPDATVEAQRSYEPISSCVYQNREMGSAGQGELMSCECQPDYRDGKNNACGANSDCINRMTSIECMDGDCECGVECQNQRFQRAQYAPVSVFKTELKGFGLRADEDLEENRFVYEYIGEVIDENRFRNRMAQYDEQGVKHFYFMMLQTGEFIDATRKGCIARFCNHSCAPNCFVDKWIVGSKLKMGIFTKRAIKRGEELTFDYNVDRYGAEPQVCYCSEPNCVGFIGGKTQTDDLQISLPLNVQEALGLDDMSELRRALPGRGHRGGRVKSTGEHDLDLLKNFSPKPVDEYGVVKIMSVLLQSHEQWIVYKLVSRISESQDTHIQRKVMKLHGYQILGSVLDDWKDDTALAVRVLEILAKWPTITRNKISSSKIEPTVRYIAENGDEKPAELARNLLKDWSILEMAYRIPRRKKENGEPRVAYNDQKQETEQPQQEEHGEESSSDHEQQPSEYHGYHGGRYPYDRANDNYRIDQRFFPSADSASRCYAPGTQSVSRASSSNSSFRGQGANEYRATLNDGRMRSQRSTFDERRDRDLPAGQAFSPHTPLPSGWQRAFDPQQQRHYYYNRALGKNQWKFPDESTEFSAMSPALSSNTSKLDLQLIIDEASRQFAEKVRQEQLEAEERRRKAETEAEEEKEQRKRRVKEAKMAATARPKRIKSEHHKSRASGGSSELSKEAIAFKLLLAHYVPNVTAKFQNQLGKEKFKKRAKEIVSILVEKQQKCGFSHAKELDEAHKSKIKKWAYTYMEKAAAKADARKSRNQHAESQHEKEARTEVDNVKEYHKHAPDSGNCTVQAEDQSSSDDDVPSSGSADEDAVASVSGSEVAVEAAANLPRSFPTSELPPPPPPPSVPRSATAA